MILTAPQSDLSTALEKVEHALSSGIPVFRQVLLNCTGKWAVFTAHNTTYGIKTAIPLAEPSEETLLLPPEAIRAVRAMPPGDVTLLKNDGRLVIESSLGPKYQLGYGDPIDYLDVTFGKRITFTLDVKSLFRAIRYLSAFKTETVLIDGEHLVSTDGFRMCSVRHIGDTPWTSDKPVVVPWGFFPLAEKVLDVDSEDHVGVIIQAGRVTFIQGVNAISTLRSDKKFPSYETALGSFDLLGHFETTREDLLAACARASVIAAGHLPMRLDLKSHEGGEVSTFRTDVGTSEETLPGFWHGDGDNPYSIAFNAGLLRAMVATFVPGSEVRLSFDKNPKNMFRIDGPDDEQVVFVMMPMVMT